MKRLSLLIIAVAGLLFILMPGRGIASASERETELFNKGYEYLFSYKPDKAAETFRIFLKEFPESSARDAALFWLGKTLISMKMYGEAELTFQTIQKEFPESPFIVFIAIEMEEIAKVRATGGVREARVASETQKPNLPKDAKDEAKSPETDRKLRQLLIDRDKTESLLEEERKANRERMRRIAELEAAESLLKKQNVQLEDQAQKLADMENSLKESKREKDRLSAQIAQLSEKSLSVKDAGNATDRQDPGQKSAAESGESLRFRLAQLELLSEEQGKELSKVRGEQDRLKKLAQEEQRLTAELRAELALSKDREKGNKATAPSSGKDSGNPTGEVNVFNNRIIELQAENTSLAGRNEDLERQAEERIRDMRILNAYLASLMFRKKEAPQQKPDGKTAGDGQKTALTQDRPSSSQLGPDAIVRIGSRSYPLSQIIEYHVSASLVFKRLGIKDIAWRTGNPLDDFISEELLYLEAKKAHVTADAKKQKEIAESQDLGAAEANYLEKFMTIARYIDTQYADDPAEKWIELISVDYRPGDAAAKTVLATDLQKAAREGKSFEEIGKTHPDGVKFLRLSISDFSTKYKEKSQIIQKLNFLNEETVVIWSEKGFMLIKPVSGRVHYNPFEELSSQNKERLKAFLKQWFAEHMK